MLRNYLKIALRNLRAKRIYTTLNIIGLSVGMASGLLLFLFISYHLSTDRHHHKFDRIYRVVIDLHLTEGLIEYYPEAPLPLANVLRKEYPQVEHAAFLQANRELTVSIPQTNQKTPLRFIEHEGSAFAEGELFQILDYKWLLGNPKTALQSANSVVLTQAWAERYFGKSNPIGRTIELNHSTYVTVTGIVADPTSPTDINFGMFISLPTLMQVKPTFNPNDWAYVNSTDRLYLTLKNNAVASSLESAFPAISKKYFGADANVFHFHLQSLADIHFDTRRKGGVISITLIWSLALIGLFLVLTACINFINIATAQAFQRSKEVGIRKTLGSSRIQLIGQFLLETGLIVVAATLLSILLAWLSLPLFNNWIHIQLKLQPTFQLTGFIVSLMILILILAGGYPALIQSGFSPWESLKGKLKAASMGRFSLRQALVVLQFVICQALIVGSLVIMKQIQFTQQKSLGFQKDNVILLNLPIKQPSQKAFKDALAQHADVKSVTFQHRAPSSSILHGGSFKFDGKDDWAFFIVRERLADADFLNTYGLELVAGRNISERDSIQEYLINETMLHKLGFQHPQQIIGKRMQYYLSSVPLPIVGVVKDFHLKSLHESIDPCFIACYPKMYSQAGIRISQNNTRQTLNHIRKTWAKFYPNDVFEYEFLDEQLAKFYENENSLSKLINVFALIAISLCMLGLYGLVALVAGQRTKEIGIRKVLGASVASIIALLSSDFLKLVALAILIASPLAWYAMNKWLQDFAYHIQMEWWMIAFAATLATTIALTTVSFQSIKAALMNPVQSLKIE